MFFNLFLHSLTIRNKGYMCSLACPQITRLTQGMKCDQIKLKKLGQSSQVRRCAHFECVALWWLHFQYGDESCRNRQILTEHSVEVRPFLFPFTIGKYNFIYSECIKVFLYVFVAYSMVLKDQRNHCFLVCNLRPCRCMEPFKYLDGRFDPSSTALTKRSRTLSNGTCVSRILSAGV